MRKQLIVVALATAVVLAVVPVALAAGHHGGVGHGKQAKGKPFLCKGVFNAVNADGTLAVTVTKGSHDMRAYFGQQEPFTLNAHAHIFIRTVQSDGSVVLAPASVDQLTAGSAVHINGRLDRCDPSAPVFHAQHIIVTLAPAPAPSDPPSSAPSTSPSPSD